MKTLRAFLLIVIAQAGAVSVLEAQVEAERPTARLLQEIRTTGSCEHHMSVMDEFFSELSDDPGSQGAIVIYQPGADERAVGSRERMLRGYFKIRNFEAGRVTMLRGTPQSKAVTQFWIVPPGADMPSIVPEDPNAPKTKPVPVIEDDPDAAPHINSKPYIYINYSDVGGVAGCEEEGAPREAAFVKRLKENPGSRGNIVIKVENRAQFGEKEKEIVERMLSYGIPRSRFQTFYSKSNFLPEIELWILPRRRK